MASFYPYLYEAALALCIDARIKAGLTQTQLAERFGQTEGFVASYESGGRPSRIHRNLPRDRRRPV